MKTLLSKINLTAFALFLLVLPSLNSCKKDDDDKNDQPAQQETLDGKWNVTSFKLGGVEVKGLIVKTSKFEFDATNATSGDFTWTITYMDGSAADTAKGDYALSDGGKKITLIDGDGDALQFDVDLDGDQLEISGTMDEGATVIKAEKE